MSKIEKNSKIVLENVHKSFGNKHVLQGVDLSVNEGESMVIIGGSGTGKSVTLKCILGMITPDQGSINVDGKDITKMNYKQRHDLMGQFGMLFQGGALFDSLKVWENIAFGLIHGKKMAREEARQIALNKLLQVGLSVQTGDLYPAEISGGMQKRVSLARAIATEPDIIFFDEPTTGLDPIMADVINNLIVECVKDLGATAVTITHDMASARKIADQIAMIHEGKIIWNGPVKDLYDSKNGHVEQFIHGRAEGPITKHSDFAQKASA
ncbi:MAG: ATP-binding cassette domain-containing protein [Pseudomonadota bacterium]